MKFLREVFPLRVEARAVAVVAVVGELVNLLRLEIAEIDPAVQVLVRFRIDDPSAVGGPLVIAHFPINLVVLLVVAAVDLLDLLRRDVGDVGARRDRGE